jgi:hypothetical protein
LVAVLQMYSTIISHSLWQVAHALIDRLWSRIVPLPARFQ